MSLGLPQTFRKWRATPHVSLSACPGYQKTGLHPTGECVTSHGTMVTQHAHGEVGTLHQLSLARGGEGHPRVMGRPARYDRRRTESESSQPAEVAGKWALLLAEHWTLTCTESIMTSREVQGRRKKPIARPSASSLLRSFAVLEEEKAFKTLFCL